jgi:hypothetical protein
MLRTQVEPQDQRRMPYQMPGSQTQPAQQPADGGGEAGGFDRVAFRDNWKGGTPQDLQAFIQNNPQFASGVQTFGTHGDKVRFPTGEELDVIQGAASGGTKFGWTPIKGEGGVALGEGSPMNYMTMAQPGAMTPGVPGAPGMQGVNNRAATSPYTPGQLPTQGLSAYAPGKLSQFTAPNQGGANQMQQQALMQALQSGGSMNPQVVAQMKGAQQEQGATMLQQAQQRAAQNAATMGRAGSGLQDVQNRRLQDSMQSQLLGGYRDIDINAAQTNFDDVLRASGALDASLGREAGTATDFYRTGLTGQMAQEGLNQAGVNSQNEGVRFALERALAQEGLNQSAAGMGEGSRQFDVGQDLARAQLGQQNSQFYAGLGEQGRQYNMGYGLDAARLNAQRERDYLSTLFGGR